MTNDLKPHFPRGTPAHVRRACEEQTAAALKLEEQLRRIRRAVELAPAHLRPEPTAITVPAAARRLGLKPAEVKQLIRENLMRTCEVGGRRHVAMCEFRRLEVLLCDRMRSLTLVPRAMVFARIASQLRAVS